MTNVITTIGGGDKRVRIVYQVWMAWERLCQVAASVDSQKRRKKNPLGKENHDNHNKENEFSVVAFMARTGRSMEPFAWLAVTLYPEQCQQPIISRSTKLRTWPLHLWASSYPRPPSEELDALGRHLLGTYPNAVQCTDEHGRLPIHCALYRGNQPLQVVQELALTCPATLGIPDPTTTGSTTGSSTTTQTWYPFAMAASVLRLQVRSMVRATERRHPSQRLYDWLDTCRRQQDYMMDNTYEQEISTQLVGHVYVMLRALPQALEYMRYGGSSDSGDGKGKNPSPASPTEETDNVESIVTQTNIYHPHNTIVKDTYYAKVLHDIV
jgi:hypothetical protein